jgi:hypothetical protein
VEPDEFLTRAGIEALSEAEEDDYADRFFAAYRAAMQSRNFGRRLAFTQHLADLAEWTLPHDEYVQKIELPAWNLMWEDPEQFIATLEELANSPEATEEDRQRLAGDIAKLQTMAEAKRQLGDLGETGSS